MVHTNKIRLGILALGIVLGSGLSVRAQQGTQPDVQQLRSYNLSRESFLLGTVVKFTTASDTPPTGAHIILDSTYFAARIVQKGAQAVAVRNTKGFLTTPASVLTPAQKEALRGVR